MARPNLLTCYQKMASLQEKMQHLQDRFGFSNISGVINSAQIDLQQVPPSTLVSAHARWAGRSGDVSQH